MSVSTPTSLWPNRLVATFLVAMIGGVLLASTAPVGRLLPLAFGEAGAKKSDGECSEGEKPGLDSFELFAAFGSGGISQLPRYRDRLADESVDAESALSASHLQRGPPRG